MSGPLRLLGLSSGICLAIPASCLSLAAVLQAGANETYATRYYADKVDVKQVLASREWHPVIGARWRDCSYAIVRFTENSREQIIARGVAATTPAVRYDRGTRNWPAIDSWSTTPLPPQNRHNDDAYLDCKENFEDTLLNEIDVILAEPGSWAIRSWGKVYILSPQRRLAAYIRYGD